MATKDRSIIVDCRRVDLGTVYALFQLRAADLKIVYLNVVNGHPDVRAVEVLDYADYPEARLLHDGAAWNVGELQCWLGFAETQKEPEQQ